VEIYSPLNQNEKYEQEKKHEDDDYSGKEKE